METLTATYLFGLSVALPFGPVSMMIVVHSVRDGPAAGLAVAIGCVTGGLLLATLILVTLTLAGGPALERVAGSGTAIAVAVFALLGVRQLRAALAHRNGIVVSHRVGSPFSGAFALALTNPMTVLPFLAFLTAVAAAAPASNAALLPLAIASGQLTWYVTLSLLAGRLRPFLGRLLPVLQVGTSLFLFACSASLALQLIA